MGYKCLGYTEKVGVSVIMPETKEKLPTVEIKPKNQATEENTESAKPEQAEEEPTDKNIPPENTEGAGENNDSEGTKLANAINDTFIEGKFGTDALDSIIGKLQDTDVKNIYQKVKERIKRGVLDARKVRERLLTTKQGSEEDQAALLQSLIVRN